MSNLLLAIEVESDDFQGYHAVIVDLGDDAVLFVSDSYSSPTPAVLEALCQYRGERLRRIASVLNSLADGERECLRRLAKAVEAAL